MYSLVQMYIEISMNPPPILQTANSNRESIQKEATEVLNNLSQSPLSKLCLTSSLTFNVPKFYYEEISHDTCNPISMQVAQAGAGPNVL